MGIDSQMAIVMERFCGVMDAIALSGRLNTMRLSLLGTHMKYVKAVVSIPLVIW
jgi:hypothetical protein